MFPVQISECRLRLARRIEAPEAPQLRGFFGRKFEDNVLMHNHGKDGQLVYEYPRIQFKVIDATAVLLAIAEGAELIERLWLDIDETKLGDEHLKVLEAQFETREEQIAVSGEPIEYRFLTPLLALNQKNFRSYTGSRNTKFCKDELSRIFDWECLGLAKSLGIRFQERIDADCRQLVSIKTSLKGNGIVGFVGKFKLNLRLPELMGLGKSVSRGFGTVSAPLI